MGARQLKSLAVASVTVDALIMPESAQAQCQKARDFMDEAKVPDAAPERSNVLKR
jgi:hypothetical protein